MLLAEHDLCLVQVKTSGVKAGTDILCLPESSVKGLFLESALCTLGDHGTTLGAHNLTNA